MELSPRPKQASPQGLRMLSGGLFGLCSPCSGMLPPQRAWVKRWHHALLSLSQEEGEPGKGKDFISLGLKDGHLLFR